MSADPSDVEVLPGGTDPGAVADLYRVLAARLAGADLPPLLPVAPGTDPDGARAELAADLVTAVPAGTAVLLRTSGSTTGRGHVVALGAAALTASARATHERLGAPGRWVLAVPAHHVAGLQILTRSFLAGAPPAVLDTAGGFEPGRLAEVVAASAEQGRTYLSLVPTQLVRALAAGPRVTAPLARAAAILVGGAALAPAARRGAAEAGLRVVRTYGMTETGGGCVYDGVPLDGVRVEVDAETRVHLSGPVLATGYLDDAAAHAATFVGGRLRTTDSGRLAGGRLEILGRLDDALTTGGVTVSPLHVERHLGEVDGVAECAVVGVPDPEWGDLVVAVVVPASPSGGGAAELLGAARAACADLSPAHAPRALVLTDHLPLRGPGKVDRRAVAALAADALHAADARRAGARRAGDNPGAGPADDPARPAGEPGPRVLDVARHGARTSPAAD